MAKRTASTELNHDNWCDEDEPEEAGTFQRASADDLKRRQIKTARRRGVIGAPAVDSTKGSIEDAGSKSIFAGFSGFKRADPAPAKALFSFLSATPNGSSKSSEPGSALSGAINIPAGNDSEEKKAHNGFDPVTDSNSQSKEDKDYYRKLKGLNESVSKWISSHVASNPLCILTPVFNDYEKHLAAIQSSHSRDSSKHNTSCQEALKDTSDKKDEILKKEPGHISSAAVSDKGDRSKDDNKTFSTNLFGSNASATFSFGSSGAVTQGQSSFCFGSSPSSDTPNTTPTFSFGTGGTTSPSAGFSFGAGKPFTFANVANSNPQGEQENNDEDEEESPPKPDHKTVNEDGATYTKRCKVYVKQDDKYSDRGIGNLFLKPVDGAKTQLIVRADTSLGNVLLNLILSSTLPLQRVGPNNVAIVCIPTPEAKPPPVMVLLRVKTSDDADELLDVLEKHKKQT